MDFFFKTLFTMKNWFLFIEYVLKYFIIMEILFTNMELLVAEQKHHSFLVHLFYEISKNIGVVNFSFPGL